MVSKRVRSPDERSQVQNASSPGKVCRAVGEDAVLGDGLAESTAESTADI